MAGMKLLGGAGTSSLQAIVYIIIISVVVYLIYIGKISNPITWVKGKMSGNQSGKTPEEIPIPEAFTNPVKWIKNLFSNKKEGIGGQIYGVGQTSSSEDNTGTYGYAKALTYDLQRNVNEEMERRLLKGARENDMRNLRKIASREGLANLHLEKLEGFKPENAIGFAKPYEPMSNLEQNLYKKGYSQAIMSAYNVPYASSMGAASFANRSVRNNLEKFNQVFLPGQNIGSLAITPEAYSDIKVPKRNEYFTQPIAQLKSRPITEQDLSPNIAVMGAPFGFQDPTQVDMRVSPSKEKFGLSSYMDSKYGSSTPYLSANGTSGSNIPYTSAKARFRATYKSDNCPCKLDVSDDPTKQNAYSQKYNKCIKDNKCTIGTQLDGLVELNGEETIELAELAGKYTQPQLQFVKKISILSGKSNLTKDEKKELSEMKSFYGKHKDNLDRINFLVNKSLSILSNQQYITPEYTPSNACRVTDGLISRDDAGNITRYSKYSPQNACNYVDYRINNTANYDATLASMNVSPRDMGLTSDQMQKYKANLEKAFNN
jgi:hypothetical protein